MPTEEKHMRSKQRRLMCGFTSLLAVTALAASLGLSLVSVSEAQNAAGDKPYTVKDGKVD
jgi:nitrous oxide reductase